MTRQTRLVIVFDIVIVLVYVVFLCAPLLWPSLDRTATATPATATPRTLAWLALPVTLGHYGVSLEHATEMVTICALAAAIAGALLSIAARMRGSSALWAVGAWLFGCSVAILMPVWTAAGFLGALLLLLALRVRFVVMPPSTALAAAMNELWPLGYAAGFAALAWRYNPQLLLKTLVIALGVALVARALVPSPRAVDSAHST